MHINHLLRGKRNSGLSALSLTPVPSTRVTGRGELRRGSRTTIQKQPRRRRHRRELDDDDSDDGSGEYVAPRKMRKGGDAAETWLKTHRHIPDVVAGYLRLVVQVSWVSLLVYILFSCFRVVRQDMLDRVDAATEDAAQVISQCQLNYVMNRCTPDLRVRAVEEQCIAWEKCMNQDPAKVGTAKVSAATVAAILNGFVAELHWKTLVCYYLLFLEVPPALTVEPGICSHFRPHHLV